ncbi:alpha/beta fold hydrolase [Fonticella tunisiensis]|uniref:Pimeloyl-ACP methyl ester carboxylesterase n=1 Tax=Fonticella tunisiensis TaxID=1096341 RepID=A0A4R7KNX4_9CLOT|nr:alpha/beta hydrolase [Fonticella tunisiensis]TDT57253.1 pimeloyl-ACP methyl ester carboxylesterase [Fonticella tunisiensis]
MGKNIVFKTLELSNGETLGYREAGEGDRTLLLIHGNMSSSLNWDIFMENMPENFRMYAVDLRGFGASTYNKPIETIKDLSDDIKLFADALGLKEIIAAGWSAGGTVAMQLASDYPELIKKLILIDSSSIKGYPVFKRNLLNRPMQGQYVKTKAEMTRLLSYLKSTFEKKNVADIKKICDSEIYTIKKPDESRYDKYAEEITKQRNIVDFNYGLSIFNISHVNNGVVNGTGEVDRITMPVLVVQGDKDKLVTMDMAREIKDGIGDNAELVILKDSGHVPFVDNPEDLIKAVVEFIYKE